jgi:hypothetical protein
VTDTSLCCEPIINLWGAYWPAWVPCLVCGILLTLVSRLIFSWTRIEPHLDPALRFIRLELAPSRQRWIAALGIAGLALIGVLATVTFRIPYPVLVFAGILLLTVPPPHRPFHQAAEVTGAAFLGAGFAILLTVTTYDKP